MIILNAVLRKCYSVLVLQDYGKTRQIQIRSQWSFKFEKGQFCKW